ARDARERICELIRWNDLAPGPPVDRFDNDRRRACPTGIVPMHATLRKQVEWISAFERMYQTCSIDDVDAGLFEPRYIVRNELRPRRWCAGTSTLIDEIFRQVRGL